ncbi:MAG: ACT domain-containing protein, partial [Myxococcota bacterium]
ARRLIREHLSLIDEDFRRSPRAREVFEQILCADKRVTSTLTAMNEIGLLGTFIPEWEHVVCRWQHVMYHTYTVDVHSIFLVEELRRLLLGEYAKEFPDLVDLMKSVDDRTVLFLGCLLHDIGKGFGGDHSNKGVERALPAVARLGLSPERQARIIFLVKTHLLMSHLAQRRDLTDPKLIFEFAKTCGDRQNLRSLYLLTFADMRASSAKAWTDWKGRLLGELFERTSELLETGSPEEGRAFEILERRMELRRDAAGEELQRSGIPPERIEAFFEMMPRRYFTAHAPAQIVRHARVLLSLEPGQLVATARRETRGDFTEVIVCTEDRHGLYANIAGVLTAHDINILGAQVYSTRNGLALEIYRVSTPPGGPDERRFAWEQFDRSLEKVLSGDARVDELLTSRIRPPGGGRPSGSPADVSVSNQESDFYTIVDVAADDRLGLLHDLTRTIAEHGCEIYISKAAKIRDQVTDTFYLKDHEGKKLADQEAIERLRLDLLAAAQAGQEARGA